MSKNIRKIITTIFIIGVFSIIGPNSLNLMTTKAYADQKPSLKRIYISDSERIDFSEDVYSYIVDVDKDTDQILIKVKAEDSSDTIKINGEALIKDDSDNYKVYLDLNKGKNKVEIEVKDDKTKNISTYTVYVYRGGKNAVYLNDININGSTIGFDKSSTFYNIELDEGTDIVELETVPENGKYSITANGKILDAEKNSIKLKFNGIGKYTINIGLKDEDTKRVGTYTLNIYLGIPVSPDISGSINAALKPNQWVIVNGRYRYNDSNGVCLKSVWFYDSYYKSYFRFNSIGNMKTGWIKDDGNDYYLKPNGEMQTGWLFYENDWYFLDSNGVMRTGWIEDDNKWYFLRNDGKMATGWIMNTGNWYYLNSSGIMKTGWIYYDKKWYCFDSHGVMETGWIKCDDEWYYFNFNGSMKSGEWLYSNSNWYYLNYAGNMRRYEWLYKDDKYYYFNEDGKMRTSTKIIDGYTYEFNKDGSLNLG